MNTEMAVLKNRKALPIANNSWKVRQRSRQPDERRVVLRINFASDAILERRFLADSVKNGG